MSLRLSNAFVLLAVPSIILIATPFRVSPVSLNEHMGEDAAFLPGMGEQVRQARDYGHPASTLSAVPLLQAALR